MVYVVCVCVRVCIIYEVYNYVDLLTHFDYCYCLMQKLESRKAVFLKSSSLTSEQRNLWKKVLIKEFMSSEESAEEDFDGKKRPALAVKPLLWRAPKVDRFFKRLDQRSEKGKTKHSKQQTLPRVVGSQSSRVKPLSLPDDFFGFDAS